MSSSEASLQSEPRIVDVGAQKIARAYAAGLLDAAEKFSEVDAVLQELGALVNEIFRERPDFERFLGSLAVSRDAKEAVIKTTFAGKATERFVNFLRVLNDHDRLELLRLINREALHEQEQRKGLMRVKVRTAVSLIQGQRDRLSADLTEMFGRQPILEETVDPDLLGGLMVQVGDWLFDASVRTQLSKIQSQLFESASHEIQVGRNRFSD
jgi:F-type H+-transporting ATPase subunit delta